MGRSQKRKPLRKGLLTSLVLIGYILLDYLFLNILIPQRISSDFIEQIGTPTLSRINNTEIKPLSIIGSITTGSNSQNFSIATELKKCLSHLSSESERISSLEDLKNLILMQEGEISQESVELENINFIGDDQKEHRIQILISDESQGSNLELRYFNLDEEGYPIRVAPPKGMRLENYSEYLVNHKLLLHQKKSVTTFKSGASLLAEEINGEAVDLLWRSNHGTFACTSEACRCFQNSQIQLDE